MSIDVWHKEIRHKEIPQSADAGEESASDQDAHSEGGIQMCESATSRHDYIPIHYTRLDDCMNRPNEKHDSARHERGLASSD